MPLHNHEQLEHIGAKKQEEMFMQLFRMPFVDISGSL